VNRSRMEKIMKETVERAVGILVLEELKTHVRCALIT